MISVLPFDGDADRCLAVDENGELVDGDRILYICGKYMQQRGELANNRIVTTIMSNLGLYKALEREGIAYEKTKVGDKYVYEEMQRSGDASAASSPATSSLRSMRPRVTVW